MDLCCVKVKGGCEITVCDTGPGIPKNELKKVFEPFYRVGGDTSRIQGTGLGLAIVKSACDEIGAQCEFSNIKPHGLKACICIADRKI